MMFGFFAVSPNNEIGNAALFVKGKNIDAFKTAFIIFVREGDLHFEKGCLQILNVAFKNKSAFMKQRKLIAGIFQFAKGMGSDDSG